MGQVFVRSLIDTASGKHLHIIDILSEQDIGSFFSPLVEAGPAFVNCLVQNKSFEKELNICTGSKLFQSFSVSVWQKG